MTDYDETRRRRRAKTPVKAAPTVKRLSLSCPDITCGHFCILEAPIGWKGIHRCAKCGKVMEEV